MTENSLAAGHVRLQVPQLKCERDLPLYHDIRELLDGCAKRFKDLPAYIIKIKKETKAAAAEYRKVSFLKLREEVDRLGAALMSIGLQGKRLAVIGKNRYEWMLGYYAQLCGLGITVPLDKDLPYDEFESSIERSKTDAVIFDPALTGYMEKLKASGHELTFICMEEKEGYLSVPELLKKGYELPEEDIAAYRALPIDGNALSIILFTSGTTSLSKAVMLTQFNITHNCWSVSSAEDLRAGDVNMAFLPYHHTFGSTGQTMMSYVGMTTVFCDGLKYIQKNICEYGVSVFICVPLLIESIHKRIMSEIKRQGKDKTFAKGVKISRFLRKRGIDLRRRLFKDVHEKLGGKLRYIISGASPLDPVVAESFTDMGIQVVQGYGMTEASPVIAAENIPNLRFGTVGKAIPGVDVMIEDPNEEGIGEIIVRGPNVMMGYYEDEEDTEAIMGDGWLHTGDLASMDSDGFVTIRGRKKNVIVLKNGKNVYPEEIETLINNLPYVSECMVFGEPKREDDPTDLILSVRIVYNPEAAKELYEADTREAIEKLASHDIESLNAELPAYKHIYRKYITDEPMEKTTTGKVKRYKQI